MKITREDTLTTLPSSLPDGHDVYGTKVDEFGALWVRLETETANAATVTTDLAAAAARGLVTGTSLFSRFARNPDVDSGTTPEDIWKGGGVKTLPSSATVISVVSASAADTSAGTGARTVTISFLDSSWALTSETVTLNGTTPVTTSSTAIRLIRAFVATAGSGGENAGDLTLTIDSQTQASILAGDNQTEISHYHVAAGHNAQFLWWRVAQSGGASDSTIEFQRRPSGGVWRPFLLVTFESGAATRADGPKRSPVLAAQDDIRVQVTSASANNVQFVCDYELLIFPDPDA